MKNESINMTELINNLLNRGGKKFISINYSWFI